MQNMKTAGFFKSPVALETVYVIKSHITIFAIIMQAMTYLSLPVPGKRNIVKCVFILFEATCLFIP